METVHEAKPFFRDRIDAGRRLGEALSGHRGNAVVLAVPRGGVPVAMEVARHLNAGLDLIIPRKVAIPANPEAGYGAVTEDGSLVLNEPLVRHLGLTRAEISEHARQVKQEIRRRSRVYRSVLPPLDIAGKTTILVDDGLASGYTMLAAVDSVREKEAARTIVAAPVASGNAFDLLSPAADELVCLVVARTYGFAVASFYDAWYDLDDNEVLALLREWNTENSEDRRRR
jgi:putative phosphoribosyl transferase